MRKSTFANKLKAIKDKAVNATANVISAPAQYKAYKAGKQATSDVRTIKRARAYDKSTSDEATMARTAAQMVKDRITKKKK